MLSKSHRWPIRGRTLNDAFIILDEENTIEQMKMFLTRIGLIPKRL